MTQDIRLALRSIVQTPSYALMVIGSLAIGIAAPALAFALVNVALFRPPAGLHDPDGLVAVGMRNERGAPRSTYDDYLAAKDRLRDLVTLAAQTPATFALSRNGSDAVMVGGELVSGNYFETLGVRPVAGRFFGSVRDVPPLREPIVVIGYATWRRHFQADPSVVGDFVFVNGTPVQVAGVAPEGFHGATGPENEIDLWLPVGLGELALRREGRAVSVRDAGPVHFTYVGRLRSGVTVDQLQAAVETLAASPPDGRERPQVVVGSLWGDYSTARLLDVSGVVLSIMTLPLLVLAIACVNAANLVLARAMRSSATWSVRLALGATPARLLRQPFVEGVLLALPSAAGGLLLVGYAKPFTEGTVPFDLSIDWRVVAFAGAAAFATPIAFGVVPAWAVISRARLRRPGELHAGVKSRARAGLVIAQIALSLALLGTGTQFVRTLRAGLGDGLTRADRTLVASFDVEKLPFDLESADAFYTAVLERARTVPGAEAATIVGGIRFVAGTLRFDQTAVWLAGDAPGSPRRPLAAYVAGDAFAVLGLSLVRGRKFADDDHRGAVRTVIVNEPFERQLPGGSAIGRTVRLGSTNDYRASTDAVIVGVVGAGRAPRGDQAPAVFVPNALAPLPVRTLYVPFRDAAAMTAAAPAVREVLRAVDARVPFTMSTLQESRITRSAPRRFMAVAIAVLGAAALLLAAVGLHAIASYLVELRQREIGIRMAVGASAWTIVRMVLGEALRAAVAGGAIGVALAAAAAVLVRGRLYGTGTIDPIAFGSAVTVLFVAVLVASALPAHCAARVDPAATLRSE